MAAAHPKVRFGSYPNVAMGVGEAVGGHAYKVRAGGAGLGCSGGAVGTGSCCPAEDALPGLALATGRASTSLCPQALTALRLTLHSCTLLPHSPACLQVKLQFESRDKGAVQAAVDAVRAQLPDTFTLPARK